MWYVIAWVGIGLLVVAGNLWLEDEPFFEGGWGLRFERPESGLMLMVACLGVIGLLWLTCKALAAATTAAKGRRRARAAAHAAELAAVERTFQQLMREL